jgi:hypothetical protein
VTKNENSQGKLGAGERTALQVVAQMFGRPSARGTGTRAHRIALLRGYGLSDVQVAYISQFLDRAQPIRLEAFDWAPLVSPEPCPIAWKPSILTPVFWGREEVITDSEVRLTIYYPALDGAPHGAALLRGCGRYPLILFLHGACQVEEDHLFRWQRHLAQLARCGFVVAAPYNESIVSSGPATEAGLARAVGSLHWMRSSWQGREVLLPAPSTGVLGHSYGAMLAGRVVINEAVGAYASLSPIWGEWSQWGLPEPLSSLSVPSLHIAGTDGHFGDESVSGSRWDSIPRPKHRVTLHGGVHWEYLRGQTGGCSPEWALDCSRLGMVAGDLVAGFFARYLQLGPEGGVPSSLSPPDVSLTGEQELFAGSHLMGLKMLPFSQGCAILSEWESDDDAGSHILESPQIR